MGIAVVTGSGGLIDSESVGFFAEHAFKADYSGWRLTYGIEDLLRDIYEHNVERWAAITR